MTWLGRLAWREAVRITAWSLRGSSSRPAVSEAEMMEILRKHYKTCDAAWRMSVLEAAQARNREKIDRA